MALKDIITVNVTKGTVAIATKNFGIPMILGSTEGVTRAKKYGSFTEVKADYESTDPEYIAAEQLFSQSPSVKSCVIGQELTADADIKATLDAVKALNNSWFGIILCDRTVAVQEDVVEWTETETKIFITGSADSEIIDTPGEETSIAYFIKNGGYENSHCIYSDDAATKFPEAVLIGWMFPQDPGSYSPQEKRMKAIVPSVLTEAQKTNAKDKYCGTFTTVADITVYEGSKVGSGEWLDVVIFSMWIVARLQETGFQTIVNSNGKIPYTPEGAVIMENAIIPNLERGITVGGIAPLNFNSDNEQNGGYLITPPVFDEIPDAEKLARNLPDMNVTIWLAGAIHSEVINVYLTV